MIESFREELNGAQGVTRRRQCTIGSPARHKSWRVVAALRSRPTNGTPPSRAYRCPQADRRDCRQRDIEERAPPPARQPVGHDLTASQRAGNAPKKGSGIPSAPLWFTALRLGDNHEDADGRQPDHPAIARKGPRRLFLANPPMTPCRLWPDFGTEPANPLATAANPSAAHPRWSPTTIGHLRPGWVMRTAQSGHITPQNP